MVGYSKWSKDQHIKGPLGVKRGAALGKRVRQITLAARLGGGSPAENFRLRPVVQTARIQNMPEENATRAMTNGSGELAGARPEAASQAAATDNKNRRAADFRFICSKHHGSLAAASSVLSDEILARLAD